MPTSKRVSSELHALQDALFSSGRLLCLRSTLAALSSSIHTRCLSRREEPSCSVFDLDRPLTLTRNLDAPFYLSMRLAFASPFGELRVCGRDLTRMNDVSFLSHESSLFAPSAWSRWLPARLWHDLRVICGGCGCCYSEEFAGNLCALCAYVCGCVKRKRVKSHTD